LIPSSVDRDRFVLAGPVDACIGFFVEQADQSWRRATFSWLHDELVVVGCDVRRRVQGAISYWRRHLVVRVLEVMPIFHSSVLMSCMYAETLSLMKPKY
jgi:hypothetical protein